MAELEVRSELLHKAADACEGTTAVQVRRARQMFAEAEGAPARARMGTMLSASAATTCIATWHDSFREAHRSVRGICDKLPDTASTVDGADQDAAALYRGVTPEIPVIQLDIGR